MANQHDTILILDTQPDPAAAAAADLAAAMDSAKDALVRLYRARHAYLRQMARDRDPERETDWANQSRAQLRKVAAERGLYLAAAAIAKGEL